MPQIKLGFDRVPVPTTTRLEELKNFPTGETLRDRTGNILYTEVDTPLKERAKVKNATPVYPAARCIAPSMPPPPRRDVFAAFTITSTSSVVMSPCMARRTGMARSSHECTRRGTRPVVGRPGQLAASFSIIAAICSRTASRALYGRIITLNSVIQPSSSQVMMSTPLTETSPTIVSNSSMAWWPSAIFFV